MSDAFLPIVNMFPFKVVSLITVLSGPKCTANIGLWGFGQEVMLARADVLLLSKGAVSGFRYNGRASAMEHADRL